MTDWLGGFFLVPGALSNAAAGGVLTVVAVHLLAIRGASRATRFLGLMVAAGALNNIGLAAWHSLYDSPVGIIPGAVGLSLVPFFLMLFAYHFVEDDRARERRVVTWIFAVILALNLWQIARIASADTDFYNADTRILRRIYSDLAARSRPTLVSLWFEYGDLLVTYAWPLVVLLRKCVRLERAGGASALRALITPRTPGGRATRDFGLIVLCLLLLPIVSVAGFAQMQAIIVLFATCAGVWVYVNHSSEPTTLRFKLVAIPLGGVIGLLALGLVRLATHEHDLIEEGRRREAARLVALADAGGIRPGDPAAGVRFVIAKPLTGPRYLTSVDPLWLAPDMDVAPLLASNRSEAGWVVEDFVQRALRTDPSRTEDDARREAQAKLAENGLWSFFRRRESDFYGALLPGEHRYRTVRSTGDSRTIEVGWSERALRRQLHDVVLPFAWLLLLTAVFWIVMLPILFRASILAPVRALMAGVQRVERGDLSGDPVASPSNDELGRLGRSFDGMVTSVRDARDELEQINAAAFRFVPRPSLEQLGHSSILDTALGQQQKRRMSVLFADVRDFTTLAESLTPDQTFAFVNALLREIGPVVREHGGFIDKYLGDAVMALFPRAADDAVAAAVAIQAALADYNIRRAKNGELPIRMGVGVHTGDVMLGIIGESERLEVTVIGDAVNTASRLEGLTKQYGERILISGATHNELSDPERYAPRFVERARVKGRESGIDVYAVPCPDSGR